MSSREIPVPALQSRGPYADKRPVMKVPMNNEKPLILIVDDEAGLRFLLQNRLEKKGFKVDFATDGENAWTKLSQGLTPDMVVSDMKMPGMDGVELLRHVRGGPQKDMPFVFMTGFPEKRAEDEAKGLGCVEIFIKPFSYNLLVSRIERYFSEASADQKPRGA